MPGKAVVSLTTGMEDAERVTVAFLVAVGAAETGRPTLMFLTKGRNISVRNLYIKNAAAWEKRLRHEMGDSAYMRRTIEDYLYDEYKKETAL